MKLLLPVLLLKNIVSSNKFFLGVQVKLEELEADLLEINANNEKLKHTYNELSEYKLVQEKVWFAMFFTATNAIVASDT